MGAGALHYRLTVTDTSARVLRTLSFRDPLIEGPGQGEIVILTDHRAEPSRRRQLELLGALGPDGIVRELSALEASEAKGTPLSQPSLPHLNLPGHHDVRATDVNTRRLYGNLAAAADRGPADFSDLLSRARVRLKKLSTTVAADRSPMRPTRPGGHAQMPHALLCRVTLVI